MTAPIVHQCRTAANTVLPFNGPAGPPGFVPVAFVPVSIAKAGAVLQAMGQCLASARPGEVNGYAGFGDEYFSATGLVISSVDPTGQASIDIGNVTWIDKQDGGDAWYQGGGVTNPYCRHFKAAVYKTSEADIGQRWVMLLAWVTSYGAGDSDTIICPPSETYLDVLQFPA